MILYNIWVLPILFILHDFEEIIFMPLWKKTDKFQSFQNNSNFFGKVTNGSAFSVGVLEEFIILLCISLLTDYTHNTKIYLGFCIAYFLHFIVHFILCYRYKGYVPGVITASCQIPIMIIIINHYLSWDLDSIYYTAIATSLAYINVYIMHKAMPKIQTFLFKFFNLKNDMVL